MANRSLGRYTGGYYPSSSMDDFFNQSLERFFGMNPFGGSMRGSSQDNGNRGSSLPAVNISESDGGFTVEVAAPGMSKENFNVDVQDSVLTISAERSASSENGGDASDRGDSTGKSDGYHRREFSYSSFQRQFSLPDNVNDEEIKASYEDGILRLEIPKVSEEEQKPKRRTIEIG